MSKISQLLLKEPINGLSHLLGALATVILAPVLLSYATNNLILISYSVYLISMFCMFMASAVYHLLDLSPKVCKILRILDHCMIFVMIAGTYTPIITATFTSWMRFWSLFVMWGIAVVGIVIKAFFTGRFRVFSTVLYIVMGWLALTIISPIAKSAGKLSMTYMFFGGIFYTLGAVIYSIKKPNLTRHIRFHEIFHVCVLLGAASMFMMILTGTA